MVHSRIKKLWQQLSALATQLDDEEKKEAYRIAELLAPMLAIESTRVKDHIKEFVEADGSQRDALLWIPLPWRQAGLPFPSNKSEVMQYACIYGVLWSLAIKKVLHTSPQELTPLLAKALHAKESILEGYAEMTNTYWEPVGSWFVRFINNGAGALADFRFKKAKLGRIVLADSVAEMLARAGFEAAISARDSVFREEGSPYRAALETLGEVIENETAKNHASSASAIAEILAATIEFRMKLAATFLKELAQKDSKTRHTFENAIVASIGEHYEQLVAEFRTLGYEVEVDGDLASIIGCNMRKALAREIILDSRRRRESLAKLCQEGGLDRKFLQVFGEETGYLERRGRPPKKDKLKAKVVKRPPISLNQ